MKNDDMDLDMDKHGFVHTVPNGRYKCHLLTDGYGKKAKDP